MLNTSELDYDLPESAIARTAAEPRDSAKLLVVRRSDPSFVEHRRVSDLPGLLHPGDLIVVNSTRVLPARLIGYRADTRGTVEGLFLGLAGDGDAERRWKVLLRGRRMKPGITINLLTEGGGESGVRLALVDREGGQGEGEGAIPWRVEVYGAGDAATAAAILDRVGRTPLPPYILGARKRHEDRITDQVDRDRYQCVYAGDRAGSVAAPTAGLHFTPSLLSSLEGMGVNRAEVTLHVGTGTFKPVECAVVEDHPMHAEWCSLPASTGLEVRSTRTRGGRVLAVGTTTVRTLESFSPDELRTGGAKWSKLLITPGYTFKNVDGLMTNFHLPRSTLMAMVAALLDGRSGGAGDGAARLKSLYAEALERGYRFYSYGDAMLILP
ncbi:MAG TPA: tRNA preQ1(34) S-adenosylmethionine ribosyltransferase-isomerase QueA [Phycisphaerales bacterium]|nr:tRNA preQ1(34) S-adenosylmethionine ribosyltransferase-isomerase QueA [Phycisphaerales bacterium]